MTDRRWMLVLLDYLYIFVHYSWINKSFHKWAILYSYPILRSGLRFLIDKYLLLSKSGKKMIPSKNGYDTVGI